MRGFEVNNAADYRAVEEYILARSDTAADTAVADKLEQTRWIVDAVRKNGDAAVQEFTERFDGVTLEPDQFELGPDEIDAAVRQAPRKLVAILERAYDNIRRFHEKNLRQSWEETLPDGTVLGQRVLPVEHAGVYVPGGKAFYPSSVLMNIAPAAVAGVRDIVMVSPPSWEGSIHPVVLAAAKVAGATRVFRVGGAQAVAALAYGTETLPAVNKITGPGNTFVTAAKALVRNTVEIDSEAGPSEVLVVADAKANPAFVAWELLAQAEHDEEAACMLVTTSADLARAVEEEVARRAGTLPRREIIKESLDRFGAVAIVRSLDDVVALANLFAPEHLSIQTEFPRQVADRIHNAGAMMLGAMTPVAVGDYYAGPNHILPTGRRARFASPLSAEDFRKVTSVLYYSRERLEAEADDIVELAQAEQLSAHARAVLARKNEKEAP